MKFHEMMPQYWPYTWQRLFCRIELVTYPDSCREAYICHFGNGDTIEFRSMDELDTYTKAVHRLDVANGEEDLEANGSFPPGYF